MTAHSSSTGDPQSLPSVPPWLPAVLAALDSDYVTITDCVEPLKPDPDAPPSTGSARELSAKDTYNYGATAAGWLVNVHETLMARFPLAQPAAAPSEQIPPGPITPRGIHQRLSEIADRFGSAQSSGDVYRPLWEFAAATDTDADARPLKSVLRGAQVPLKDAVRAADRLSGGPLKRGAAAAVAGVRSALPHRPGRPGRSRRRGH